MLRQVLISVIIGTIAVYTAYNYNNSLLGLFNSYLQPTRSTSTNDGLLITSNELKRFNGIDNNQLYLVILGNVFDVTKGASHYGPGKDYNTFIGKDNTKAFVTGSFELQDASDEVIGFGQQDLRALNNWLKFYHKEYKYVGKHIGRYYDENGELTPYGRETQEVIRVAEQALVSEELEKHKFPPCNVEWDPKTGTRFWCTKKSGGIDREWVGVPRKLFEVGASSYRCACVNEDNMVLGNIKEFEDCESSSESCNVPTE